MALESSLLIEMYRVLCLTRALEDQISYLYHNQNPKQPLIIGKGYLSTGQEAISVGCGFAVQPEDWVAPSHRDMGLYLARGITPQEIFAQYFCRATGATRGRDANVHMGFTQKRMLGFVSHMGAALPVANGLAMAARYLKEKSIVLAVFGDGASSQGCVHEAMNYAGVMRLPVVFVCNNNRWAISTPVHQQTAVENIADRAKGYGFKGDVIDGNDVVAVYEAVSQAVEKAREGQGPTLIECKSMRVAGHGTHDPANYIPSEEKESWKKKDPIVRFRNRLIEMKMWDDLQEAELQKSQRQKLQEAVVWASKQPQPKADEVLDGVFSG